MSEKHHRSHTPRPARQTRPAIALERLVFGALLLVIAWSMIQVIIHYPKSFYPRFSDEAIYAFDVRVPSSLFDDFRKVQVRYAPAKLGFGIPLAVSVALFGQDGPMYHSTFWWILTLGVVAVFAYKRFGRLPATVAVAFLAYTPMFGKYIADVGPTTMASCAFVFLWVSTGWRKWWTSGLCLGFIAFLDFKWAVPSAAAWSVAIILLEREWSFKKRLIHIAQSGVTAVSLILLAMLVHPPYAKFFKEYVFPHSGLVGFEPSPIFVYFLLVFGALPAALAGVVGLLIRRSPLPRSNKDRFGNKILWYAVIIGAIPLLFYSLYGVHKALRFFAVLLPTLSIPIGVGIAFLLEWLSAPIEGMRRPLKNGLQVLTALTAVLIVSGMSEGPARHLTLPTGFPEAIERLRPELSKRSTISSYIWAVVAYGWPVPFERTPFAYLGLCNTDRWIALDPMLDRVAIEQRIRLAGEAASPDSVWKYQTNVFRAVSDSLFSVRSDFYASDYFMCEQVANGIGVMKRWRSLRPAGNNYLELRQVNEEKIRSSGTPTQIPPREPY